MFKLIRLRYIQVMHCIKIYFHICNMLKSFFCYPMINSLTRCEVLLCVALWVCLKFGIHSESRSGRRKYCARHLRKVSSKSKAFSTRSRHASHSSPAIALVRTYLYSVCTYTENVSDHIKSSLFTYNLSRASCRYHICPLWEKILRVINRTMAT